MARKFILDTNMLVLAIRDSFIWHSVVEKYEIQFCDAYISIVSQAEILSLAKQFRWKEQKTQKLQTLLSLLNIIPVESLPIINAYIDIDLYSQKLLPEIEYPPYFTPRNMGKNDIWIAATANATNATLISTDKDFAHLQEVFIDFVWIDISMNIDKG